ncbi:hypothetical protein K0M31_010114 [Melipona bicolor]|uniref:Uncharacterized protein n=1 Tax=Melipona bicolor TaxID=60889 RepID=A0AA40FMT3_9HYME|nr:hypothetical protein K0M31_010114 [Melipona bicolor]
MLGKRMETARVRDVWVRKEGATRDGSVGLVAGDVIIYQRDARRWKGCRDNDGAQEEWRGVNDAPESGVFVEPATDASR